MKWKKFTIDTTTEAVDFISEMLSEKGIEGIEIEDSVPLTESETKGMFVDILPELPPDDGRARVSFYLSADSETRDAVLPCGDAPRRVQEPEICAEELLAQVREGLEEIRVLCEAGSCEITESETEDQDWMNSWKEYFKPFTVGDILIRPSWEEIPEEYADRLCVTIDPGSAFGTGSHETTRLCILQLIKYIRPGMEVLDVGCGSGILGITALKLGAGHAFGTDLDESAVAGTKENAARNGFSEADFTVLSGNILDDPSVQEKVGDGRTDLAVANILAPVIVGLIREIPRHLKPGALFVTSGIVEEKEAEVVQAFRQSPDFEILEITRENEWVSVTAQKNQN